MANGKPTESDALDILRFYAEAGVDTALDEQPVDRFAQSKAIAEEAAREREAAATRREPPPQRPALRPAPPPQQPRPPAQPSLTVPSDAVVMAAREAAAPGSSGITARPRVVHRSARPRAGCGSCAQPARA
jgi:DNA polymerase